MPTKTGTRVTVEDAVLAVLRQEGREMTVREIVSKCRRSHTAVYYTMFALQRADLVEARGSQPIRFRLRFPQQHQGQG